MFFGIIWIILSACLIVAVLSISVMYSKLNIAKSPPCRGPFLSSVLLILSLLYSTTSLPVELTYVVEIMTCGLSIMYTVTKIDMLVVVQATFLILPYSKVYTKEMVGGILPMLAFIILFHVYLFVCNKQKLSFSRTFAFMLTLPLFRVSYVGLIAYLGLAVMANSFILFQNKLADVTNDDDIDNDENIPEEVHVVVDVEELNKAAKPTPPPPQPQQQVQQQQQPAHVTRSRLMSTAVPPSSLTNDSYRIQMRPHAVVSNNVSHQQQPPALNVAKEESKTGSFFMRRYEKS